MYNTECPFYRVPENGGVIVQEVCIHRDMPSPLPCSRTP